MRKKVSGFWFLVSGLDLVAPTRNQKPETRNQKPETRNQRPDAQKISLGSIHSLRFLAGRVVTGSRSPSLQHQCTHCHRRERGRCSRGPQHIEPRPVAKAKDLSS